MKSGYSEKSDSEFLETLVQQVGWTPDRLIPLLQAIQDRYRWLPPETLENLSRITRITPTAIAGVSTFYSQFRHRPVGEHIISVCHGTACHVKGSRRVLEAMERELEMVPGSDTDPTGKFTIEGVACLGCCTLAPVVQIDGMTYGHVTSESARGVLDDFLRQVVAGADKENIKTERLADGVVRQAMVGEIRVGLGSCCMAQGSREVHEEIGRIVRRDGVPVVVRRVGCVGMCHRVPLVEMVKYHPDSCEDKDGGSSRTYANVTVTDLPQLMDRHFPGSFTRQLVRRVAGWFDRFFTDENPDPNVHRYLSPRDPMACAFLGPQVHLVTEDGGRTDPLDLNAYLVGGGFDGLRRAQTLTPQEIVDEVLASGVRGRGGGGFPTGRKWAAVCAATDVENKGVKYVVCNGDEGDPGAFMDRMILESFPFRILEGMAIAAWAVGATECFLYIRAEYPLAVRRIREAIRLCEERGIFTEHTADPQKSLTFRIVEGAGAFVCGEETALLASMEGCRGMPRLRPPFPAQSGLWGKPTLINNVETFALVPWILLHGAQEFASRGTPTSRGTKVFALAGKVRRGGLIEVPMGVTLRQIVEEIGGGVQGSEFSVGDPRRRELKAVQVGGPSGGCVPAAMADLPVDYEELMAAGAIMGSGGLVVLDDTDCMVDIARYFLQFTQEQSCGKCTFCRVGTRRMLDILDRIVDGRGRVGDLEELERLANAVKAASLCGLGKTAPNPVLSTLKFFHDEYEAHLAGRCPAGRCKSLVTYHVNAACTGCTICAQRCPVGAIEMTPYRRHRIDDTRCTRCDVCRPICPAGAIETL